MRHSTDKPQDRPEATIRRYRILSWILAVCAVLLAITCVFIAIEKRDRDAEAAAKGLHTPNIERECAGSASRQTINI